VASFTRRARSRATSTDPTGALRTVWMTGLSRSDWMASAAVAACVAVDGYTVSNTARASPFRLCNTFATRRLTELADLAHEGLGAGVADGRAGVSAATTR